MSPRADGVVAPPGPGGSFSGRRARLCRIDVVELPPSAPRLEHYDGPKSESLLVSS
jgi:transposase